MKDPLEQVKKKIEKQKVKRPFHIAIVGASGLVGRELVSILQERQFPVASLKLLASANSKGETVAFADEELRIEELKEDAFRSVEIAFFAVDASVSKQYIPFAVRAGAICIDKSSAFRMHSEVPLVVPELNAADIGFFKKKNIIASPNCTATPIAQVLWPLQQQAPIKRVVFSSYQAVSGAGKAGVDELEKQVRDLFNMRSIESPTFRHQIAFNVIPAIPAGTSFDHNDATEEEAKVIEELQRLMQVPALPIAATCVRVPVFNGHSVSLNVEFQSPIDIEKIKETLVCAPGIIIMEDRQTFLFPMPLHASGQDMTLVGRIRKDVSVDYGLSMWLSSDNLRTGAALNAARIAEILCAEHLT